MKNDKDYERFVNEFLEWKLEIWNEQLFTSESVSFLADMIKTKPELQSGLWAFILSTRENEQNIIASANAITVLNQAKIAFSGKDLSHISVRGANLREAIFDNTNLSGADLRNVNLSGAWLQGANFSQAQMMGVEFGEYPSLLLEDEVESCCYSPDGKLLAVATGKDVHLYDTNTHALVRTFKGHSHSVRSIAISCDGILATGSDDGTAKIWDVKTGDLQKTLEHDIYKERTSVVFSLMEKY